MGHRKDDVRIYVISGLFFACSTGGGILLCLYIFLPHVNSQAWFSIVGLVLVAIPWTMWFLIYLYRCFRPIVSNIVQFHERVSHGKPCGTPKSTVLTTEGVMSPSANGQESSVHSLVGPDGDRHVHFGAVVVVGNEPGGSGDSQRQKHEADMNRDRREGVLDESPSHEETTEAIETEMPLTLAT